MKPIILGLLFAITASAEEAPPTARTSKFDAFYGGISRPALYGCTTFDYLTTRAALRSPYAAEANPILGQGAVRQAAFVFGPAIAIDLLSQLIRKKGKPRLAASLRVGVGAVHCVGGFKNLALLETLRRMPN